MKYKTIVALIISLAAVAHAEPSKIVSVTSGKVFAKWTPRWGAQPRDEVRIYRQGEPQLAPNGNVTGWAVIHIADAEVENVFISSASLRLLKVNKTPMVGDQVDWMHQRPMPTPRAFSNAEFPMMSGAILLPAEEWTSEPFGFGPIALAVGEVMEQGKRDFVVASNEGITLYRLRGNALQKGQVYSRPGLRWGTIDCARLKGGPLDQIIATGIDEKTKTPKAIVLESDGSILRSIDERPGVVRLVPDSGEHRILLQRANYVGKDWEIESYELAWNQNRFQEKPFVPQPPSKNQLLGLARGDFDGDENASKAYAILNAEGGYSIHRATYTTRVAGDYAYAFSPIVSNGHSTSVGPRVEVLPGLFIDDLLLIPSQLSGGSAMAVELVRTNSSRPFRIYPFNGILRDFAVEYSPKMNGWVLWALTGQGQGKARIRMIQMFPPGSLPG